MHILFTGGGTGGHILPNLGIIKGLRHEATGKRVMISYIGEKSSLEEKLCKEEGEKEKGRNGPFEGNGRGGEG